MAFLVACVNGLDFKIHVGYVFFLHRFSCKKKKEVNYTLKVGQLLRLTTTASNGIHDNVSRLRASVDFSYGILV